MTNRRIVALLSDTHGGSSLGLLNPATTLPDADTGDPKAVVPNDLQKRLWGWYLEDVAGVLKLAGDAPITLVHLGDPTQGTRFSQELTSTALADHIVIALENLRPWWAGPVAEFYQVAGTGVHEFFESSASRLILREIRQTRPAMRAKAVYHGLLDAGGPLFDLAHHGAGPGARNWLRGNVLRLYARSQVMDDLDAGQRPADVIVRGHYHVYTSEVVTVRDHETRAIILPSYQWPGEHTRKAAQSPARVSFGMVAFEIVDSQISRPHVFKRTIDFRTRIITGGDDETPKEPARQRRRRN